MMYNVCVKDCGRNQNYELTKINRYVKTPKIPTVIEFIKLNWIIFIIINLGRF